MIKVWPSGCVCQALRAPGSNVTLLPLTRAGSGALNSGSTRTAPVKYSAGPLPEGCEPLRLISMVPFLRFAGTVGVPVSAAAGPAAASAANPPVAASMRLRVIMTSPGRLLASASKHPGRQRLGDPSMCRLAFWWAHRAPAGRLDYDLERASLATSRYYPHALMSGTYKCSAEIWITSWRLSP